MLVGYSAWLTSTGGRLVFSQNAVSEQNLLTRFKTLTCILLQEQVEGEFGDARRRETMAALQAEVARLEAAQSIQRAADSALDSLQDKITVMQVRPCTVASA